MARPRKDKTAPKPKPAEAVKPSEVQEIIPEKKLKSLFRQAQDAYTNSRSIAGTIGEKIKTASEHDHLHAKAFRSVCQEARMTAEKLNDYYASQEHYREILGLNAKAQSALRLDFENETGEEDESADNVVRIPAAAAAE